jgi:hypothetical protein
MVAGEMVKEARMVRMTRVLTEAPVVREAVINQSHALSHVGAQVRISFLWAF